MVFFMRTAQLLSFWHCVVLHSLAVCEDTRGGKGGSRWRVAVRVGAGRKSGGESETTAE